MKKILGIIFISLLFFNPALNAQTCSGVTVEVTSVQHGSYNTYGVKVTLAETYTDDVTVTGTIYDDDNHSISAPFTVTVTTGNLTEETVNVLTSGPASTASVESYSVSPCPFFDLSEGASQAIVESSEFQDLIQLRNEFLDKIDSAVNQASIPLDSIKAALLDAIINNNYQSFYSKLFSSNQAGEDLIASIVAARDAFLTANPFIEGNPEKFTCAPCEVSLTEKVTYFFNHFEAINANRYINETEEIAYAYDKSYNKYTSLPSYNWDVNKKYNSSYNIVANYNLQTNETSNNLYTYEISNKIYTKTYRVPTCGSWWNQIKLAACATLCSVSTVGVGVPFCGWMCWCTFCSNHSVLGATICAD